MSLDGKCCFTCEHEQTVVGLGGPWAGVGAGSRAEISGDLTSSQTLCSSSGSAETSLLGSCQQIRNKYDFFFLNRR